ncbi:hypothetical protein [Streptomyces sp. NPDC101150]
MSEERGSEKREEEGEPRERKEDAGRRAALEESVRRLNKWASGGGGRR